MFTFSHSRSTGSDACAPTSLAPPPTLLTTTAWSPQADITVATWVRQGRWLGAIGRGSGWWIGDWIRYGSARYGERYDAAARVTGYDVHSLTNMAYVAGRFERTRRRESLSFSHHAELTGLGTEEQDLWLDRAEAGALSVRSLRCELRQARRRAASRTALAEARRRRDGVVTSISPQGGTPNGELEGPSFADSPAAARRAAAGSQPVIDMDAGTSGPGFELVCPECGCHFDSTSGADIATHRDMPKGRQLPGASGRARIAD